MNTKLLLGTTLAAIGVAAMLQAANATDTRLPAVQMSPKNFKLEPGIKHGLRLARLHLACKAAGAPEEFPTGIRLTNDGARPIPAGTRIHWAMNRDIKHPPIHRQGEYTFAAALPRGKSIGLAGVMNGAGQGEPCTVTFLGPAKSLQPATHKGLKVDRNKPLPKLGYHASCKVLHNGDVDYGLYFINDGVLPIAAGAKVHWVIKSDKRAGYYTFNKNLPRGKAVEALAHPAHVTIGAPCTATFLH